MKKVQWSLSTGFAGCEYNGGIAVADYAEYNVCSKCGQALDWSDESK